MGAGLASRPIKPGGDLRRRHYIRHDESGDRTVTRDAYAKEIAQIQAERPDIRVVVYDHTFEGDWAWFRFSFKWSDRKTGEQYSRAAMQSYRIEGGKLAETWLAMMPLGSTWTDTIAQDHWTSPDIITPESAAAVHLLL
jgi:SnoaL-like domain